MLRKQLKQRPLAIAFGGPFISVGERIRIFQGHDCLQGITQESNDVGAG